MWLIRRIPGSVLSIAFFVLGVFFLRLGFDKLTGKLPLSEGEVYGEAIGAVFIGVFYCVGAAAWVWQRYFRKD